MPYIRPSVRTDYGMLDRWALKVQERDNYTCVECGDISHVGAYHIIPCSRDFLDSNYDPGNGRTLCIVCHVDDYLAKRK